MSRWTKFLLVLILGAAAGLFYGWVVNPVEYVDIGPQNLRSDYKTDYTLMVAESYQVDHVLGLAVRRLADIGNSAPQEIVTEALNYALQHDYAPQDMALLQSLGDDLASWDPNQEVPTP
ncbi:MAG: hypothetical protein C3F13_17105 [Anaerolineales bacterium]|nr:hypothetical protein [Anaerolineae bacterium]PWB50186.1 MAG: hypothetical protein C3F13_17105 [Anaerolineales bacterium]